MRTALIVGRTSMVVDDVVDQVRLPDVKLVGATTIDDVRAAFRDGTVDTVVMGAGIDLDARLDIIREVFQSSDTTSVHMKDRQSGPSGFLPFVRSVLAGAPDRAGAPAQL